MLETINFNADDAGQQFVDSLQTYGFAAFDQHPLDTQLIHQIYREWSDFFDSGHAEDWAMSRETQDGYFSTQTAESAKGEVEQDYKEYFHYYTWGRCPPELLGNLKNYYEAAHQFAATLLSWIEQYSPDDVTFSEPLSGMITASEMTLLRVLRYPPLPKGSTAPRAAAHGDINLLTILPAADEPGLEILGKNGDWLTIKGEPDQVLINIGDMLEEASGHYFPSTQHRVVTPPGQEGAARMSLPLFLHPRPDVVLSDRYTANSYLDERLNELGVK